LIYVDHVDELDFDFLNSKSRIAYSMKHNNSMERTPPGWIWTVHKWIKFLSNIELFNQQRYQQDYLFQKCILISMIWATRVNSSLQSMIFGRDLQWQRLHFKSHSSSSFAFASNVFTSKILTRWIILIGSAFYANNSANFISS